MTEACVLIVDDDVALLQALLRPFGSGWTALWSTRRHGGGRAQPPRSPRLRCHRDRHQMPGMDGLELLAEIRTRRPDTPTLMITGHGEHDLVVEALRGGAYDFIRKPIDGITSSPFCAEPSRCAS